MVLQCLMGRRLWPGRELTRVFDRMPSVAAIDVRVCDVQRTRA